MVWKIWLWFRHWSSKTGIYVSLPTSWIRLKMQFHNYTLGVTSAVWEQLCDHLVSVELWIGSEALKGDSLDTLQWSTSYQVVESLNKNILVYLCILVYLQCFWWGRRSVWSKRYVCIWSSRVHPVLSENSVDKAIEYFITYFNKTHIIHNDAMHDRVITFYLETVKHGQDSTRSGDDNH